MRLVAVLTQEGEEDGGEVGTMERVAVRRMVVWAPYREG